MKTGIDMEKCSDLESCRLAETIAYRKQNNLPTSEFQQKLNEEMSSMFHATRVMMGKDKYINQINK